jgi:hypothetical protein
MRQLLEEAVFGFKFGVRVTYSDLVAIGTGAQKRIGIFNSGSIIPAFAVYRVKPTTGTTTNLTLDVGTTVADPDELIDALNLVTLVKTAFCTGDAFTSGGDAGTLNGAVNNTLNNLPIVIEPNFTGTLTGGEWLILWNELDPSTVNP